MNIDEQADRLETILQYEVALEVMKLYKYTFAENSYYRLICRQMEKMLIDSIYEQSAIIEEETKDDQE